MNLLFKAILTLFIILIGRNVCAQPEVMAWGNITGIRTDGQLMDFESSIRIVGKDWKNINATGKERQRPKYHRNGKIQEVITSLDAIQIVQKVEETGKGAIKLSIDLKPEKDTVLEGVFFCISLPEKYYASSVAQIGSKKFQLKELIPDKIIQLNASKIKVESEKQQIEVESKNTQVILRKESDKTAIYFRLANAKIKKDQKFEYSFIIKTSGFIDNSPVEIIVDAKNPGRMFAGFGGNFRLQNPKADPLVIQYCLDNMRVAWGRVEMPWRLWHADENTNPIENANSGKLHPHVEESMQMAKELASRGIPMIISDWSAPDWAIDGKVEDAYKNRNKGIYGYPLKKDKTQKIYQSIADYLVYLKNNYGVEPQIFSFNESDLGIDIRHTAKEHAEFIKSFGTYLASRGIATKLLLGDNSDATTFDFILEALNDPETHKYIGAVSFHSWRGCDDATLRKWADAAKQINLPLIVAEGSTDAAAYSYPEIFYEQTFALYEINLYMRLASICQPLSIIQWQLTSDYSVLKGEGIYGTQGPLAPTRRFWNLKQLAATPAGSFSLSVKTSVEEVNCAAFGNIAKNQYAVHLVNNGAARKAILKGIPDGVKVLEVFVTDEAKGMEKMPDLIVKNGTAELDLLPMAFYSFFSK